MEIGWKLLLLWTASMGLFIGAGIATWLTMDVMEGISGLTIRFFLLTISLIFLFINQPAQSFSNIFNFLNFFRIKDL